MTQNLEQFIDPGSTEIERISTIDKETFSKEYMRAKKPVVFTDLMNQWPATQKWSLAYFKTLTPNESALYAEVGDIVQHTDFQKIQFGRYIDTLLNGDSNSKKPVYLADFNIFQNFPSLEDDVDFSLLSSNTLKTRINGWIGPANTVANYHVDWADNLFAQLQGRKFVKLISPEYNAQMYPSKRFDAGSLLSAIDADNYDAAKYPRYREAKSQYTVLEPGEMLYIPYGWWHYIRALDPSISINCFAWGWKGVLFDLPLKHVRKRLHALNLYGMNGCTCHMMKDGKRVSRTMSY